MPFDFIDIKTVYLIGHLLGLAIGAGAAYMSDITFLSSVRNGVISRGEFKQIRLLSTFVWIGLGLLILSGALLFSLNPEGYMASTKFITKMLVILILTVNGIIFHAVHIPFFEKMQGKRLSGDPGFLRRRTLLVISGAISVVSWTAAIILGALRSIDFSVLDIFAVYALLVFGAVVGGLILQKKLIPAEVEEGSSSAGEDDND